MSTRLRLVGYGVASWLFCMAQSSQAQWTNPNPTGAVSVAVMVGTNGAAHTPKTLSGFLQVGADRFVAVEIQLGGEMIDNWDDLAGASFLNLGQYVTGASSITAPGAPYANVLQSGSAQTFTFARIKGSGGITASNAADGNIYIDGGVTSSVEALFPRQTVDVTRIYYRSLVSPYNMTWFDTPGSTSGYFFIDGTTPVFRSTVPVGDATNAALFNAQGPGYYLDFANHTNFWIYDDGQLDAADLAGIEAGVNADWEFVWRTNNGVSQLVARLNLAGGSNDLGRLNSSNRWTEFNQFEDNAYFEGMLIRSGQGVSIADGATVGTTASNVVASGQQSTAAGGYQNTAGGTRSTVSGGAGSTAGGSGATIAGGVNHTAGDYSAVGGGDDIDISGQWSAAPGGLDFEISANGSFGFGRYFALTNSDSAAFIWGDVQTSKLQSVRPRSVLFLWDGTNRGTMGINTASPTQALEVVGTVKATAFEGSAALLTDVPAGSTAVIRVQTPFATNGATMVMEFVPGATGTYLEVAGTTSRLHVTEGGGGSGGGGSVNFTSTWSVATTHGSTTAVMVAFGASNTVLASDGASTNPTFRTVGQLGALVAANNLSDLANAATARGNLGLTDSVATNKMGELHRVFVDAIGDTNAVDMTNAASVSVPTPTAGSHAATKEYVDTAGSASVTNAIDKGLANGGSLLTGLNTIDIVGQGGTLVSNQAAGPTGRWYFTCTASPYAEAATGSIAPTGGYNSATGYYATVTGGKGAGALGPYSVSSGGITNRVDGESSGAFAGVDLTVVPPRSVALGGNNISLEGTASTSPNSGALGGENNRMTSDAGNTYQSLMLGGQEQLFQGGNNSFLIGGAYLKLTGGGDQKGILGGIGSEIRGNATANAVVIGGYYCRIDGYYSAEHSISLGGVENLTGGSNPDFGAAGVILAGYQNRQGGRQSIVGGYQCAVTNGAIASVALGHKAETDHNSVFIWSDNQGTAFHSTGTNQFLIRASGGVGINTATPEPGGMTVSDPAQTGSISLTSTGLFARGTATWWDDVIMPLDSAGGGSASIENWRTPIKALRYAGNAEQDSFFSLQAPHGIVSTGEVRVHIHVSMDGTDADPVTGRVVWAVGKINGGFSLPVTNGWTATPTGTAFVHQIISLFTVTNRVGPSDLVVGEFVRENNANDDNMFGHSMDAHIERWSLGSDNELP